MKRRGSNVARRGTTLVEVIVGIVLMTFIFIFLTAELIQSAQTENFASNHAQSIQAANELLSVMREDNNFWSGPDWGAPSGVKDDCGNPYPAYTDTITAPTWHNLCTTNFPELSGPGVNAQFMWNAQLQGVDPNEAHLTIWVRTDEGGRNDIYEVNATRMKGAPAPSFTAIFPSPSVSFTATPTPCPTNCKSPGPSPSPKKSPSPTPTPSKTPKPSPTPTGVFE
ncbi:MAG: hypothetical protein JOZ91_02805 [Candidatus Eremiobacteraeota bacterium]|nr:hypothetical protein [Candidatus Eremiobacteraeota bacterium]MBV8338785.1 hypothetical protein [Candidatus Eremiobacteraeota bacterium]MBV8459680.1 hypothetical protein [Candidatus Eremiobacteraeota bacterium]